MDCKLYYTEDVTALLTDITGMKSNLLDYLYQYYENISEVNLEIQEVKNEFKDMKINCDNIIEKSETVCSELEMTSSDREKYLRQVKSLEKIKNIIENMLNLNKKIENLQKVSKMGLSLDIKLLNSVTEELELTKNLISKDDGVKKENLNLYRILNQFLSSVKANLSEQLQLIWNSIIIQNKSQQRNILSSHLTVSASIEQITAILSLSFMLDPSNSCISLLLTFISSELIYPALYNFPTTLLNYEMKNDNHEFHISYYNDERGDRTKYLMEFLNKFVETLTALYDNLLKIPSISQFLFQYFDSTLSTAIFDSLLVLDLRLPELNELPAKINELVTFLSNSHLVKPDNLKQLSGFSNKFEHNSRNSVILSLLITARENFMSSMLDCETIDRDPVLSNPSSNSEINQVLTSDEQDLLRLFDFTRITFPKCSVSKNVVNSVSSITDNIEIYFEMNNGASNELLSEISDFISIVPQLLDMYLLVVPKSNRRTLSDIPLAAALHYNNCMYIAHHCQYWTAQIKSLFVYFNSNKTRSVLQASSTNNSATNTSTTIRSSGLMADTKLQFHLSNFSLLPLLYRLRDSATKVIDEEVTKQRQQLTEFLEEFDNFQNVASTKQALIDQSIKKCISYLGSLSKVYDVLPFNVYDKVVGNLINSILKLINLKIIDMTDIVTPDADQLSILLAKLSENIIDMIRLRLDEREENQKPISGEVVEEYLTKNCSQWARLTNIRFILNSNLMSIEQLWMDEGNSHVIQSDEMKRLIKALFKNTSMRAKLLDKFN